MTDVNAQIVGLQATVDEQRKEHTMLVADLNRAEDNYRDYARDCRDANEIAYMIKKAYKEALESTRLRAIHDAYKAVESKAKQIQQTEGELNKLRKAACQLTDQIDRLGAQQQANYKNVCTLACPWACTFTKTCPIATIHILKRLPCPCCVLLSRLKNFPRLWKIKSSNSIANLPW